MISFLPIPLIVGLGNTLMARSLTANSSTLSMIVYKTPNCGCCVKWVVHLEELGFSVETINVTDTGPIARRYGVPSSLRSCHTAITDGYAIEGHVPAKDIIRLIEEKPTVAGLAVRVCQLVLKEWNLAIGATPTKCWLLTLMENPEFLLAIE